MTEVRGGSAPSERKDRWNGQAWVSFSAFYRDIYGAHIVESYEVGGCGAQLIVADQGEGDWSDAATPTLGLSAVIGPAVGGHFNVGRGSFCPGMRLNEFAVIPPGTPAEIVRHKEHRVEGIAIPFFKIIELAGDGSGLPADGDLGALHCQMNVSHAVTRYRAELFRCARSNELYGNLAADGLILQLVATLLELRDGQPARSVGGLSPTQLRLCLDALIDSCPKYLSLKELAAISGLSGSHFSRAFKVSTGFSPHVWAMRNRLERAKRALEGSRPLADVAADCGFSSQQHFTTVFKKYTGATPAAWRRERQW